MVNATSTRTEIDLILTYLYFGVVRSPVHYDTVDNLGSDGDQTDSPVILTQGFHTFL